MIQYVLLKSHDFYAQTLYFTLQARIMCELLKQ